METKLIAVSSDVYKENLIQAASLLKNGELVAFPTETVYGLGANALDPLAVAKIFEQKERPSFDPLIVHIASIEDLKSLTTEISDEPGCARALGG